MPKEQQLRGEGEHMMYFAIPQMRYEKAFLLDSKGQHWNLEPLDLDNLLAQTRLEAIKSCKKLIVEFKDSYEPDLAYHDPEYRSAEKWGEFAIEGLLSALNKL